MADNIVAGLFGLSPNQIQQQQQAQTYQRAQDFAGQSPFERANSLMYQGGAGAANVGAGMMGLVNPEVEAAKQRQVAMQGADVQTPEGLRALAARLQGMGMTQQAMIAAAKANEMEAGIQEGMVRSTEMAKNLAQAEKAQREEPHGTPAMQNAVEIADKTLGADGKSLIKNSPEWNKVFLDTLNSQIDKNKPEGKSGVHSVAISSTMKQDFVVNPDGTVDTTKPIGKPYPIHAPSAASLNADLLSPQAIDDAATRYRITGQMPQLGLGSAIAKSKILNKASEQALAEGKTSEASVYQQMQGKADQSALGQLEKQATMVGAFEKTANANMQLALSLSDKVDRTGMPIFNSWIQAGQKSISGNEDVAKFHAANETFVNEYAKIMSGSMGNTAISDAARKNAHELLSTAYTKEQYKAVVNTLKIEMDNRIRGFDAQREDIKNRVTSKSTPPSSQSKTSTKVGVTVSNW